MPSLDLASLSLQGGYTLDGNAIQLDGGITNVDGNNTVNMPITLTGAQTFTAQAGTLTIAGALGGAKGALTITGSGTVALTAANTYAGGTTLENRIARLSFLTAAPWAPGRSPSTSSPAMRRSSRRHCRAARRPSRP